MADYVRQEYPDGTARVDITRLTDGRVMCCVCFKYVTRDCLKPDPELPGCVIDVCKPCAQAEAKAADR